MRNIVYNIIKSLRPYFFSLREIGDNVSLDIKIPVGWRYDAFLNPNPDLPFSIKPQDKSEKNILISLISTATAEGYDFVFQYAKTVVNSNKEEEEKIKLFNQKVEELKVLFLSSPLDKLKEISFDKQLEKNGLRDKQSPGEIKLGNEEGPGGNGQS
jgi:hypothetical protein